VPLILASWAGGAVIFLVLQWLAYRAFLGRVRETSRPARPPLFGGIRTWISDAVDGPLALGVIERRIVLPGDFSRRYSPVERRLALEHELVHHRRGDIWWNLAAMVVLALFWFNPVAWIAFRAFRSDQELACDAAVARMASLDERCDYARALVKSASRPGLIAACALNPAGELKRRLRMMRAHRASRLRSAGGLVALTIFAMLGFAIGSAGPLPTIQAAAHYASAAAPTRLAAANEAAPAIVVTGRKARAAHSRPSRLSSEPMSFASAEPPALPTTLAPLPTMQPRLARTTLAADLATPPPVVQALAFAMHSVTVPTLEVAPVRTVEVSTEAQLVLLTEHLSAEDAAELRRAVADAVAQGRKVKFRFERHQAGGGSEGDFDVNIQTIVRGDK
jgi:hypothetical protein